MADRRDAAPVFSLAELRDAAEHDGESATTVYIGGPGWQEVLALVRVAEAANALSFTPSPPRVRRGPQEWYEAYDMLLAALAQFEEGREGAE